MSRKPRLKSSINTYHVVIRGADHQTIFESNNDYKKYLDLLEYYKNELSFEIYAYCLMSNHVHLLIHTPTTRIDSIFRCLNTAYAVWFNMKYNRTGFLQQGRYYSEPIEDSRYLLTALRYIHQNPLKAGLEKSIGESYQWSSFQSYANQKSRLVDTTLIISLFENIDSFYEFHKSNVSDQCLDIDKLIKKIPDDVAKEIIYNNCNCSTVNDFQSLSLVKQRDYIILLHQKGLSIRQINRLTGISKGIIERRIKTKGRSL